MIVVDASVFVKLFKAEEGSDASRRLVDHFTDRGEGWCAPTVVLYETLSAALHIGHRFETVHRLFGQLKSFGLDMAEPTRPDLALAEKITTTESPGGGYPALFDSIYHAMAIERGGTFVTADDRHIAKAGHHGSVVALADWQPA